METEIISLFQANKEYAILLSIIINILIAVSGVIPSVFITAANIIFFGFWQGVLISYIGESIGAVIAFILYRKGTKGISDTILQKYPKFSYLLKIKGWRAFYTILGFRLMPYVPSGVVTMLAAIGKVSLFVYAISSTIGKFPALMLEGYSVYQVTNFTWQGKLLLLALGIFTILRWWYKDKKSVKS